jgi:hypothetical protein
VNIVRRDPLHFKYADGRQGFEIAGVGKAGSGSKIAFIQELAGSAQHRDRLAKLFKRDADFEHDSSRVRRDRRG